MLPEPCNFPLEPGERLLVFDGVCNICSGWARFILRHDRDARIHKTTIQSDTGTAILNQLGLDTEALETLVFLQDGVAYFQTDAIFEVFRQLPPIWRWVLIFRIVPRPVRNWFYLRLARNRYRIMGKRDACFLPDPDVAARFRD